MIQLMLIIPIFKNRSISAPEQEVREESVCWYRPLVSPHRQPSETGFIRRHTSSLQPFLTNALKQRRGVNGSDESRQ